MDYPNNFDTPVFPESRKIALSRFVAVWYFILIFIIVSLCGLLVWTVRSVRLSPFMISIDNVTGEWRVIGEKPKSDDPVSKGIAMQESVAWRFAMEWFEITGDAARNAANWCACEPQRCRMNEGATCFLCCTSDGRLYRRFTEEVVPLYRTRFESGETWNLCRDRDSFVISPLAGLSDHGGVWRMTAVLESNVRQPRNIEMYVHIQRNEGWYPLTLGYYVADFNWYAINR
jgi:hypothetical protein